MSRGRAVSAGMLALVVLGTLAYTGFLAGYYRSASYREYCAQILSETLELPAAIGRVEPRTRTRQSFRDVAVWLPERRAQVFRTRLAIVDWQQRAGRDHYTIEIIGGMAEISTRTWLRSDFRNVLESTLRPGFGLGGVELVRFSDMELAFESGPFALRLGAAAGRVTFDGDQFGQALVSCSRLNDQPATKPITLTASFSAMGDGVQIDDLLVTVPELRLADLGLEQLLRGPLTKGTFDGVLRFRERPDERRVTLAGRVRDVVLAEVSRGWLPTAWQGDCPELAIEELTLRNARPERLVFRGLLRDVELDGILAAFGLPPTNARAELQIRRAELSPDGVDLLVASGRCVDFAADLFSDELGFGRITGRGTVEIEELIIRDNKLARLVATASLQPDPNSDGTIETTLLRRAARDLFGFDLPAWLPLPATVRYRDLSFRVDVQDELLYVLGGHGNDGRTILTLLVAGQPMPIVRQPDEPIDLRIHLEPLREQLRAALAEQIKQVEAG